MSVRLSETAMPDGEDLRIIRALQISPRASFATIARALASSEQTVARRFRRLERDGVIRVIGVVDTGLLGNSQWIIRLRCRPSTTDGIANALANRADVRWIAIGAGGSEITCTVVARDHRLRDDLLLHQLPGTKAVLDIRAALVLHPFAGSRGHYRHDLTGILTGTEEGALGSEASPPVVGGDSPIASRPLDDTDETILDALSRDGRTGTTELAASTGLTRARVTRRLEGLLRDGVVFLDVEIAAAALDLQARAALWLQVHPRHLTSVGTALGALPQIPFVAAISGTQNLHAVALCHDLGELFDLTTERVGALPGITALEVSPLLAQVKQAGTRVTDGRLVSTGR